MLLCFYGDNDMIKACFFDMDGTLLSHTNNDIPKSTRVALSILQEKGIHIVLATGRHLLELKEMKGYDIPFDGYILLNGHICLNKEKEIIYDDPICEEDKNTLISLFHEEKFPLMLVEKERFYCNYINSYVKIAQDAISSSLPAIDTYKGDAIYQALPYVKEKGNLAQLLPNCTITRWNEYGLDINAKHGGKVHGIIQYMEANNIKQEEIMAFGDGENDEEMLSFAHIGIAMGNAKNSVKQKADYVTSHIDEDGIYKALKHFNII